MFIKFKKAIIPKIKRYEYVLEQNAKAYLVCFDLENKTGWFLITIDHPILGVDFYTSFQIERRINNLMKNFPESERRELIEKIKNIPNKSSESYFFGGTDNSHIKNIIFDEIIKANSIDKKINKILKF